MSNPLINDLIETILGMPEDEREKLIDQTLAVVGDQCWIPNPGPQSDAYFSQADELFYGGSAGGGKSDLGLGLALTRHSKSLILRRYRDDARELSDRIESIIGTDKGRNSAILRWDLGDRMIDLGGAKDEKDKQRYKGRPHDLIVFDEVSDFTRSQYEFIITWNRSTEPGQRCRVVATGNPPTTAEGLWVIERWAAWLDPRHPRPAKSGEIRWYITDKYGKEREVTGRGPHTIRHEDNTEEVVSARSRTFIRARLVDNPYLARTDYAASLDALPAELRAAYRDGAFEMSLKDNPHQVIPTSWVMAAQARWTPRPPADLRMSAMAVDIAQGGPDETVLASRYVGWYAPLKTEPGEKTPNAKAVVALIIPERRHQCPIIVDMGGGYGGATKEMLEDNGVEVKGYKGAADSTASTKCKNFGFVNKRSEAIWKFREALDPDQEGGSPIMLPDGDPKLVSDLTSMTFEVKRGKNGRLEIRVETKEDVVAKLGRSTDRGDAVIMCWTDGAKPENHAMLWRGQKSSPQVNMGHSSQRRR